MMERLSRVFLLLLVFLLPACQDPVPAEGTGALSVVITAGGGVPTRASGVTELPYEKRLNQLQLFLFEGNVLCRYDRVDTGLDALPFRKTYESLKTGSYRVYAVANAEDLHGVTTEAALNERVVRLSDCNLAEERGFVMAGAVETAAGRGAPTPVPISLSRFAARVRLVSVENRVPSGYARDGAVTVKSVFLINALGTWALGGAGTASEWVNLGGRVAGRASSDSRSDFITEAGQVHPAAYLPQVFRTDGRTLANGTVETYADCCLYSFPNAVQTDHTGSTAGAGEGAFTRLVILATVNGADWWYPVTLSVDGRGLERNTSYDVRVVLRTTGSADPNEPLVKGSLSAEVSVNPWSPGADYSETI